MSRRAQNDDHRSGYPSKSRHRISPNGTSTNVKSSDAAITPRSGNENPEPDDLVESMMRLVVKSTLIQASEAKSKAGRLYCTVAESSIVHRSPMAEGARHIPRRHQLREDVHGVEHRQAEKQCVTQRATRRVQLRNLVWRWLMGADEMGEQDYSLGLAGNTVLYRSTSHNNLGVQVPKGA